MTDGFVLVLLVATAGAATAYVWSEVARFAGRAREAQAEEDEIEARWQSYSEQWSRLLTVGDFVEAGWSRELAVSFLKENFASRDDVLAEELRPFFGTVLVDDLFRYFDQRREAAERFGGILYTWVKVDDLEKSGRLPEPVVELACERDRSTGRMVRVDQLLPFVGRPVIRNLLEEKLADCSN